MSYFSSGYSRLTFPVSEKIGDPGLRRAQLGAIHSIAAHFSIPRSDAAIVIMPTGTGKTAVIDMAPFVLRSNRVLVLTPSQLVRTQIAEEFSTQSVLKAAGVLRPEFEAPKVREVKERLSTAEAWENLKEYDFVVATPHCVSPGIAGIATPPEGIFDLIIMDEAHHSEAPRWADILVHFRGVNRLLFTATPFRRDKRELRGTVIYNFPLRLALQDEIFGKLRFLPVTPQGGEDHDVAIARQAETEFNRDIEAGYDHRIMVRTDSKKRADILGKVYAEYTKLKLAVVYSGQSLRTIKKTLALLRGGELNGIICVAMMGEGFDFPQLKIAAIHAPHKSLAVTLQFIGRFARTRGSVYGEAKFLAVPQDIEAETKELYKDSSVWQEIVENLSSARIEKELKIKEISASFSPVQDLSAEPLDVVSTDFRPYFHVKIYKLESEPDLQLPPSFGDNISLLRHEYSEENRSSILLLRQVTQPRWSDLNQFSTTEYDLVVIYYHDESGLLFINSSRRSLEFYSIFESQYGNGTAALLPGPRLNRVIEDLKAPDFFSIGLKNSVQNSNTESYQIKTGPSAQNSISPTDGLRYQRGHLFGKGENSEGKNVTIGYSSSSKVWSNYSARVGELIEWCQFLAKRLATAGTSKTGTPLDYLEAGEEINCLLSGVVGVGWPEHVFRDFPRVEIQAGSVIVERQLLDVDLHLDLDKTTGGQWEVALQVESKEMGRLAFSFEQGRPTWAWIGEAANLRVITSDDEADFMTYIRHHPLAFFMEDFSRVEGGAVYYNKNGKEVAISKDCLIAYDWKSAGIDIEVEFPKAGADFANPTTVQDYLGKQLQSDDADVVFYDHGSGEIADFVTLKEDSENRVLVRLYHCKGSGGKAAGDRVGDAYEVCGQVVKCLIWLKKRQLLKTRIEDRGDAANGHLRYLKGSRKRMQELLGDAKAAKLEFEIVLVQPGISISSISEKIAHIVGAASDYVQRASGAKLTLIGSK